MDQLEIEKLLDQELLKAELAAEKQMRAALKSIQQQIAAMYSKYEQNGVLTTAEMAKYNRLDSEMKRITTTLTGVYQQSVADIQEMQENHYLLKFLLTAYLFDRFVSLPRVPSTEIIAATFLLIIAALKLPRLPKGKENDAVIAIEKALKTGVEKQESKKLITQRIKKAFPYRSKDSDKAAEQLAADLIERLESTINTPKFDVPNRAQAKKEVKFDGLTLSHYLTVKRNRVTFQLRQEIETALRKNETVHQLTKRINEKMEKEINSLRLFMRNASDRVRALAQGSVENQISAITGVQGIWLSKRDNRVREAHQELDGQRTTKKGYFRYKGMQATAPRRWGIPSMDNYCRCRKITLLNYKIPVVEEGVTYNVDEYNRQVIKLAYEIKKEKEIEFMTALQLAKEEIPPPWSDMPFVDYSEWLRLMGVKGDLSNVAMPDSVERFLRSGRKPGVRKN